MLVRLFKTKEPVNLIILLILMFVTRIPYMLGDSPIPVYNYSEPFSSFLFSRFPEFWSNKLLNVILTSALYFSCAVGLNKIANDFNLLFKNTFLPSLLFVIITGVFPTFYTLDAAIIVIIIQLWVFIRLFRLYKSQYTTRIAYDVGILVALASLFYFPAIAWIVLVWISLLIFRPFYWREWASSLAGVITPYIFVAFFYFWNDRLNDFLQIWMPLKGTFWQINVFPSRGDYVPLLPMAFILIISFNKLRENFYKNVVHVRKAQQILIVSIFVTAFSFYIKPSFSINHFILLAVPLTIFLSYFFLVTKKSWVSEGLILLLIVSTIVFQLI